MMTTRAEVDRWFAQQHDESRATFEGNIAAYDYVITELEAALQSAPDGDTWQIYLALGQYQWIRYFTQIALDKMDKKAG